MTRIVVLTPTYAGYDEDTRKSICKTVGCLPIEFTFLRIGEVYIHAARRKLLQRALELHRQDPYDFFLWLDSDIGFEPQHVTSLVEGIRKGQGELITGLYFNRHGNTHPMVCQGNDHDGYQWRADLSSVEFLNRLNPRYQRVDGCGFGFLLMSAEAVKHYASHYPSTEWFDSSRWNPTCFPVDERIYVVGEDLDCCEKMKAIGHDTIVDTHVRLRHKGVGFDDWCRNRRKKAAHCPVIEEDFSHARNEPPVTDQGITRRAVLYVGYICNIRCEFCYYAHKPAKKWRSLAECKRDAELFRTTYGNTAVDITGGEPTIFPDIMALVSHCRSIGLRPTLITNNQALADEDKVLAFKNAGVEDFLCSLHGWGEDYDRIVHNKQGFARLQKAVENLEKHQIPFRVNCTIIKDNLKALRQICEYSIDHGAKVINFISFNPFYEWEKVSQDFQATYREIEPFLREAFEYCDARGVEANARYYPLCLIKGHEEKCYNFAQLPYDPGEWDFKSWYSDKTDAPCHKFPLKFFGKYPDERTAYFEVAKRVRKDLYAVSGPCDKCSLRLICDGLTVQYAKRFGDGELRPYEGNLVEQPYHFLVDRRKHLTEHWKGRSAACVGDVESLSCTEDGPDLPVEEATVR